MGLPSDITRAFWSDAPQAPLGHVEDQRVPAEKDGRCGSAGQVLLCIRSKLSFTRIVLPSRASTHMTQIFLQNDTVYALTALDSTSAVDITATQKTFAPLRWRVRGMVQMDNQTFFSNGKETS